MAIQTKNSETIESVYEYLNLSAEQRLNVFLGTITEILHAPTYWFDFPTISKHVDKYGPDICMLDYLKNKTDKETENFFKTYPSTLKTIPALLGIRDKKMDNHKLAVFDPDGDYNLDFANIDITNIDNYMKFLKCSGLLEVLQGKGIHASVHDYTFGVEAGLNSNARKNRSGVEGESHLDLILENIVQNHPDKHLIKHGQTTYNKIVGDWYHLTNFPSELSNRRFDGSLFCPEKKQGLFAEVNNFNSAGSKTKGVASEFENVHTIFSKTNHVFVYITDGKGWEKDSSHLGTIIEQVPYVLNYAMVEDGWLDEIAKKIM